MPTIADFTVVSDAAFTLPGDLLNDRHFPNLSFPAVSGSSPAVLMFRVDPVEIPAHVVIQINNVDVVSQIFDTTPQRTWHEVIGAGTLKAAGNEMVVAVLPAGTATSAGSPSPTSSCSSRRTCPEPVTRALASGRSGWSQRAPERAGIWSPERSTIPARSALSHAIDRRRSPSRRPARAT